MRPHPGNRPVKWWALAALAGCALTACAVGPDYHKPDLKMPAKFAAVPVAPGASNDVPMAQSKWWKTLGDDELSLLIERAIKANPQLEIALAHVQEAREQEEKDAREGPGAHANVSCL